MDNKDQRLLPGQFLYLHAALLTSLTSPALAGRFFTTSTTWETPLDNIRLQNVIFLLVNWRQLWSLMQSEKCCAVLLASSGQESMAGKVGNRGNTPLQEGFLPARMLWGGKAWVLLTSLCFFLSCSIAKISLKGVRAPDLVGEFRWAVLMPRTHPCCPRRLRIFVCQGSYSPQFHHIDKMLQVVWGEWLQRWLGQSHVASHQGMWVGNRDGRCCTFHLVT